MSNPLATVERIAEILPHPNADRLVIANIRNYRVVIPKGVYSVGDIVGFIHPDTCLLDEQSWANERKYCGKNGRVRAINLRGQYSMGLVIPISTFVNAQGDVAYFEGDVIDPEYWGLGKYEPPADWALKANGNLPYWLPKTDETNWQNLDLSHFEGESCHVTLKLDGTSASYYVHRMRDANGTLLYTRGLTTRTLDLVLDGDTVYHRIEKKHSIFEKLVELAEKQGQSIVLRGEITGAGIQGGTHNPDAQGEPVFHAFSIYFPDEHRYAGPNEFRIICDMEDIPTIEVVEYLDGYHDLKERIQHYMSLDTISRNGQHLPFEGVVFKFMDGDSFKVINPGYDARKS